MLWVGFEPTVQASARATSVHALDVPATVTGKNVSYIKHTLVSNQKQT
jgi:FAD synthase